MNAKGCNEAVNRASSEPPGCNKRARTSPEPASNLIGGNKILDEQKSNEDDQLNQTNNQGKENQNKDERFCHRCNKSLSKARHFINITGQAYKWHPECFKCNVCNQSMDRASTCYIYKDKIVCRDDYLKLQRDNSTKCSRCRWSIGASDWVRKAGDFVYHLACFSCDICLRQMSTGEQFTVNIQDRNVVRLLCKLHFAIEPQKGTNATTFMDTSHSNTSPLPNLFEFNCRNQCSPAATKSSTGKFPLDQQQQHYLQLLASTSQTALMLDRKSELLTSEDELNGGDDNQLTHAANQQQASAPSSGSSSSGSNSALVSSLPSKSKRVRTTFTEDQLSILQTHFQIDSNPDGQDLERIATITGLSKRVTQVWFQNSRARQKKYLIKRKPSSSMVSALVPKTMGLTGGCGSSSSHQFGAGSTGSGHHHHSHIQQHSQQQFQLEISTINQEESASIDGEYYQQKWSNMSNRSDLSNAVEDIDGDRASQISSRGSTSDGSSSGGDDRDPSMENQSIVSNENSNE